MKAIHAPSGENVANAASAMPDIGVGSSAPGDCTNNSPRRTKAIVPSGPATGEVIWPAESSMTKETTGASSRASGPGRLESASQPVAAASITVAAVWIRPRTRPLAPPLADGADVPAVDTPCTAPVTCTRSYVNAVSSSASLNSPALLKRSAGNFSRPFDTTARTCFGTLGRVSATGRGSSVRIRTRIL